VGDSKLHFPSEVALFVDHLIVLEPHYINTLGNGAKCMKCYL
jgi:hypothetical protein